MAIKNAIACAQGRRDGGCTEEVTQSQARSNLVARPARLDRDHTPSLTQPHCVGTAHQHNARKDQSMLGMSKETH